MKNFLKFLTPLIAILTTSSIHFANNENPRTETPIPFLKEDFQLVDNQEKVLDHYVYSLNKRPKRLYKNKDGRYWMIHGGNIDRQHIAAYLSSGLYELFLGKGIACEYQLMIDENNHLLIGSPFILDFQTLANYAKLRHYSPSQHNYLINTFLEENNIKIEGLEMIIALGILFGEQDLHPYNLGFIATAKDNQLILKATRVGTQHGFIGFNEYNFRDNKSNYIDLENFFLAYKGFGFDLKNFINLEKLAEAFEHILSVDDQSIINILDIKLNTLEKYGIIVKDNTATHIFLDNTKYENIDALHKNQYDILTPVEEWSVNAISTEKLFTEAYEKQPTWRINDAEMVSFSQEILARKKAAGQFANEIRKRLKANAKSSTKEL